MAGALTLEAHERVVAALDIAQRNAVTTVGFQMDTRDLTAVAQPGAPLFGIASVGAIVFGGGVPLTGEDGRVGGVGVSGGSPEQDHDVAVAGAAAL
jgi:uncharacterized protein GlcG (DUF336 family)